MKIKYTDILEKTSFTKEELLAFACDNLIEDPPEAGCGILPAPPMLMLDRVTKISHSGNKGIIIAEQDISLDDWFFLCHFRNDPVQPGCLGVDAVWQLIGLYGVVRGAKGTGRALGLKEVEMYGQIRPHNKIVRYEVEIRRHINGESASYTIGSATVFVDGQSIYTIKDAKVGFFTNIRYGDYPHMSINANGGQLNLEQ